MNRILIVEDEVPIAQLIEMSLARAGYQCEAVNDGCAAADKIEQNDYDLVLLDIMLPGLDSLEAAGVSAAHGNAYHFSSRLSLWATGCAG